jgi:hypothetical protein
MDAEHHDLLDQSCMHVGERTADIRTDVFPLVRP